MALEHRCDGSWEQAQSVEAFVTPGTECYTVLSCRFAGLQALAFLGRRSNEMTRWSGSKMLCSPFRIEESSNRWNIVGRLPYPPCSSSAKTASTSQLASLLRKTFLVQLWMKDLTSPGNHWALASGATSQRSVLYRAGQLMLKRESGGLNVGRLGVRWF